MPRNFPVFLIFLAVFFVVSSEATDAAAQTLDANTIRAALRTATPEENGFVDRAVRLVQQGRLPDALLRSTFLWAKRKPRWKFQYFRRALTLRAARIGIRL
ncbi:MAG: hypothetical protein ACYTG0_07875 [Planctomycetota bacterium]|jgi:hypothetical protein